LAFWLIAAYGYRKLSPSMDQTPALFLCGEGALVVVLGVRWLVFGPYKREPTEGPEDRDA